MTLIFENIGKKWMIKHKKLLAEVVFICFYVARIFRSQWIYGVEWMIFSSTSITRTSKYRKKNVNYCLAKLILVGVM